MAFLFVLTGVIFRIPGHYISSLRTSVLRRLPLSGAKSSLARMEVNYIVDQYEKAVSGTDDRFGYFYILDIIRHNYSPELNFILLELLENEDRDVRLGNGFPNWIPGDRVLGDPA
jgi:hypothetical protein